MAIIVRESLLRRLIRKALPSKLKKTLDSHVFTDVALTVPGFACPATPLLETALAPAFTGGELTLDLEKKDDMYIYISVQIERI
jgi:hypothetical protein